LELIQERGWTKESNVNIFTSRDTISEVESEIITDLLGSRISMLNDKIIRFDGKRALLVTSNVKKFLILPK
jgi:hypothetical protein